MLALLVTLPEPCPLESEPPVPDPLEAAVVLPAAELLVLVSSGSSGASEQPERGDRMATIAAAAKLEN
ncbi:hypothetical protein BE20_58870 [Sorangium cellulosum]|uniref:Uncharacterized protein n=1 Tax=Sorangium cellulosum TaxID=56 RepID=A0A150T4G1_SORCE|nr:hypothetical protein BE18_20675 [Sorangium cellulosum]KYF99622.1 hypothetical protein BE20_58870 [Sorangium cellulosum]